MSLPQRWLPTVIATCPFVGAMSTNVAAFGAGWRSGVSVKSPLQDGARLRLFNELIRRAQKKLCQPLWLGEPSGKPRNIAPLVWPALLSARRTDRLLD